MYLGTIYISTKFRPDRTWTSNMAARWRSWKTNKVLLLLIWLVHLENALFAKSAMPLLTPKFKP
jgi:hypothetical protein